MDDSDPYDMYVTHLKLRGASFFFFFFLTDVQSCLFITSTLRHFNTPRVVVVAEENVVSIVSDTHLWHSGGPDLQLEVLELQAK